MWRARASTIPINYAILESGVQTVSTTILPNIGDLQLHAKSEVKFNLKTFDVAHDFTLEKQFGEYQSETVGEKKLPVIKHAGTFTAEVPYTLEAWQNGKDLDQIDDCREKLDAAYKKVSRIIQEGRFDDYKKEIAQGEKDMAVSMYLSETESESWFAGLVDDFKSGFEIQPVAREAVMLICGGGKVAVLKKVNGEPAMYLENREKEEELMLDISFYIPEGKNEFEII